MVEVRNAAGDIIGSGMVDADGAYSIELSEPLVNGETVTVTQTDAAGNMSQPALAVAPDLTAPSAPDAILDTPTTVTGTGEPGATVTVENAAGAILGTGQVAGDGTFTVSLGTPQNNGERLTVIQTDAAGNASAAVYLTAPDTTAPLAPDAQISGDGSIVTGRGEPLANIRIVDERGVVIGTTTILSDGTYSVTLDEAQTNGQAITVTQTDAAGNESPPTGITAPDIDPPAMPNASISGDGVTVSGTGGEAGATIEVRDAQGALIGSDVVRSDGSYSVILTLPQVNGETLAVIQIDRAGNPSAPTPVTAPDLTAPDVPEAAIADDGASISGRGEVGATVIVRDASGDIIATGEVVADGSYVIALVSALVDGEAVVVTQRDGAGNVSEGIDLIAPDTTPPPPPTATIDGTGSVVTGSVVSGSGVVGSRIEVRSADGTLLGSGMVDAQGNFTIRLTTPQVDGEALAVRQLDPAGNPSAPTPVTAPDLTAPDAPEAAIADDGTAISGRGEVGATVIVRDASGDIIATGEVGADGSYVIALVPALVDGETVVVTQRDGAGNVSEGIGLIAPDTTPPPPPTATIDGTGSVVTGSVVSGSGVAGSRVEVRSADGTLLGSGMVDAQGNFTIRLTTPQVDGEALAVRQLDPAGNPSAPTPVTAPDLTAPDAPEAAIADDGASISGRGEVGATVIVRDASGDIIATGEVGADGSYVIALVPPLVDGEAVIVTQRDGAGNVSDGIDLIAPDTTPPPPPTATIDDTGRVVTGTGVPGSAIAVRDAGGALLGGTTVNAQGNYTVILATPLVNSEPLFVTQVDGASNISDPANLTAPDLTPPAAPDASISADGTTMSGTGENGADIIIADPSGFIIGTATVGPDLSWQATLSPPQVHGEQLTVIQSDAAGNESPPTLVPAPNLNGPDAPDPVTATVSPDGERVTGTGEPDAIVTIRGPGGVILGTATVGADSTYTVELTPPQKNGETLVAVQADAEGNSSVPVLVTAPDITAPDAPFAQIDGTGTVVTGTGERGATVTVRDAGGASLGSAIVDAQGHYVVTLAPPQTNGQTLSVTQADVAGNVSTPTPTIAPDTTAPAAPTGTITPAGTEVSGTGEAGATITVTNAAGTVLGSATVTGSGSYSIVLTPPQVNGEALTLVQRDGAGNISPQVPITAPDITAPAAPTGTVASDGATVTGTGEAGATIRITDPSGTLIGTATVTANGSYVAILTTAQTNGQILGVTQADAAGNVSVQVPTVAPDTTAPTAPTGTITPAGTEVSGTGEAGATITVTNAAGTVLGSATVTGSGSYSIVLTPPQVNGEALTLVQRDGAGNISPQVPITAPDITAPAAPTGTVASDGATVTGTGEAGATIRITDPSGTLIGTATVTANGSYVATLTTAQTNGQILGVTQADAAGNVSVQVPTVAPDTTAPAAPTGTVTPDGTVVNGSGEAGATIRITDPSGNVIGTATVTVNGSYAATLTTAQTNGQILGITQADAAGNVSVRVPTVAPDITPPAAPTGAVTSDGAVVNGSGEAGATIRITDPSGTVIGTTTVAANGSYSAVLTTPQTNGQTLGITQSDGAGNISPRVTTIAPDITPPAAPTGTIVNGGTEVTGTGEPGATIRITNAAGVTIGMATVAGNGSYTAALATAQTNGEKLTLVQADAAGNISPQVPLTAPDTTPPSAPTAAISANGGSVNGQGEAGATITIRSAGGTILGTTVVAANGTYSAALTPAQLNGEQLTVTQTDPAGNGSPNIVVTAPDHTAPIAPTAAVSPTGTVVTGIGEAGATVTVTNAAGVVIGTTIVPANGSYTVTLTQPQANGETVGVFQTDAAGNASAPTSVVAPDITAPNAPANLAINGAGTTVTGIGEAGATVRVRDGSGTVIGTGQVGPDGRFSVDLTSPQVGGQNLTVNQTDAAGNQSASGVIGAPFDIAAFDNSTIALIDLLPVSTSVNHGNAAYLALVSLGVLNLQAQVLATPNVQFSVADGHSLSAVFTYDATLTIGVAAGYSVGVQRWNGTQWVAVNGGNGATLLQLSLLGGNLVSTETLGPGLYRAFTTFDGAAGVGLLGALNVSGTDSDFTDIGGIVPKSVQGNVITDPSPDGHVDIVSPQTVIQSVTVNGVTTAVNANGTVVNGAFGRLVINLDGSYSYTPSANATSIGKTDVFQYTLIDRSDGETETATLSISIGSDDITGAPVANHDVATAGVQYQNVVQTVATTADFTFSTPGTVVVPVTGSNSKSFTVGPNSEADITITVIRGGSLTLLPTYTITVKNAAGATVGTYTATAVAGLPLGSGISHTFDDLQPGTYTYTVSSTNILGTGYGSTVYIGQSITHFDQFSVAGVTGTQGELLANDVTGTAFATVKVGTGSGFVEVGETPVTITGAYGRLTVNETGHYTYTPSSTIAHSTVNLVDSFTYQIVQPNGVSATATLDVTINVGSGSTSSIMSIQESGPAIEDVASFSDDTHQAGAVSAQRSAEPTHDPVAEPASADAVVADADQSGAGVPDEVLDALAYQMFEGQGMLEDVLTAYLDRQPLPEHVDLAAPTPVDSVDLTTVDAPYDPLNYLSTPDDIEKNNYSNGHVI